MDDFDDILEDQHDHKLLFDAYYGKGGFKKGFFLFKHPRESQKKYDRRRKMAYYSNYLRPIIDSHVDPIFRKEPKREWKDNAAFSAYILDVDTCGTGMNRFMKKAALIAKIFAVAFIFTDNFADLPQNLAATLKERCLPYSYIVTPDRLDSYKINRFGKLTSITITEPAEDAEGNVKDGVINKRTWTTTTWKLTGEDGKVISKGEHNLGRLPVTVLYSNQVQREDTLPQSEFYDIARMSVSLYNRCSELDEVLSNQAFNILTYPLGDTQRAKDIEEIITGTENMLGYDGTLGGKPDFISPKSEPADLQMKQLDRLVQEMHRMARLSHVTGVEKQTSGVSKAYDFENTNQNLGDFAANIEEAEKDMAAVFELWAGGGSKLEYTASYDRDFGMIDIEQVLKEADEALLLNIGSKFNAAVKKKVVAAYLPELPEKEYDEITKEIDENTKNEVYAADSMQQVATQQQQTKKLDTGQQAGAA